MDHANIPLLIAGTYTPFSIYMLEKQQAVILLSLVWGGALLSGIFRVFWINAPKWLYVPIYLALGWAAFIYFPDFYEAGGLLVFSLIALGGVLYSLLPGDPLRAKWVADNYLENVKQYNSVRNMFGFTGTYKGERVSVQGTGMGLPSASIYVTELFNEYDVQVAIRIGTAGGIQDKTKVGDLVLAMTASTDSNINRRFTNGLDFAPHCDFHLLMAAYEASKKFERVHVGGVSSMDFFYDETDSAKKLQQHGVLALEMEANQLYSIAARKNRRALAIMTISDHVFTHEAMDSEARERTLNDMVEVGLHALIAG
ncbi:MAG: purine-nucleoside phosphorylase [Actinobacteria bacterium]|nr:purine-nucleoside phosphorylase [Actinomycetota bacterium]